MNKTQRGFTLVEVLLVLAVVAVISGVGWYAIHTKHQAGTNLNNSDKASKAPINYLRIPEWGVGASYTSNLTLNYDITGDNSKVALAADQLHKTGGNCVNWYDVRISRYKSGDLIVMDGPPPDYNGNIYSTDNNPRYSGYTNIAKSKEAYAHINDYYYVLETYVPYCSNDASATAIEKQTFSLAKSIVSNLKPL